MLGNNALFARRRLLLLAAITFAGSLSSPSEARQDRGSVTGSTLILQSTSLKPRDANSGAAGRALTLDGLFYETSAGRIPLPAALTRGAQTIGTGRWTGETRMPDGRLIRVSATPRARTFDVALSATPDTDITRWGVALEALPDEYYTGLMERVVDGPQQASWAPGIATTMNLRGQKVDMILKPTTSVYAPFYISWRTSHSRALRPTLWRRCVYA
jgi:hypothetical protein